MVHLTPRGAPVPRQGREPDLLSAESLRSKVGDGLSIGHEGSTRGNGTIFVLCDTVVRLSFEGN